MSDDASSALVPTRAGASPMSNRRIAGRMLFELRKRAKMTQQAAGGASDVAPTTLGRIEKGDLSVKLKVGDMKELLSVYGATDRETELLLSLVSALRKDAPAPWWLSQIQDIPPWFADRVSLEEDAELIREYGAENVPGLLQTATYARALILLATGGDASKTNKRVEVRMERTKLLAQSRPRLDVILNESVLHRLAAMGKPGQEQLQHLLDVTEPDHVTLLELPYSAGTHGGMAANGGFTLLRFPQDEETGEAWERPFVYLDSLTGSMSFNENAEVEPYERAWKDMASKTHDPQATRLAINKLLDGMK